MENKAKKLSLNKKTLQTLSNSELKGVGGADVMVRPPCTQWPECSTGESGCKPVATTDDTQSDYLGGIFSLFDNLL